MVRKKKFFEKHMPRVAYARARSIQWHEVTWYSQLLTLLFCFGVVPALSFYIGTQYQQTIEALGPQVTQSY